MSIEPFLYETSPCLRDQCHVRQLFPAGVSHGGAPIPRAMWGSSRSVGDSDHVASQVIYDAFLDFDGQVGQTDGVWLRLQCQLLEVCNVGIFQILA